MAIETSGETTTVEAESRSERTQMKRLFLGAAALGGLSLVVFSYVATRWGPLDSVLLLGVVFVLLLFGYSILAAFAVRLAVIAPFIVAALLLPWACGAAVALGALQRADSAVEEFTSSFSGDSNLEEPFAASEPAVGDYSSTSSPDTEAAAATYTQAVGPAYDAFAAMATAEAAYFESNSRTDRWALQVAESKLAIAFSQAATQLEAYDQWPQSVASDVESFAGSMRAMAQAAQQMSEAASPEEREGKYAELAEAQMAGAYNDATVRETLGIPEAE